MEKKPTIGSISDVGTLMVQCSKQPRCRTYILKAYIMIFLPTVGFESTALGQTSLSINQQNDTDV